MNDNVNGKPSQELIDAFRSAIAEQQTGYSEDFADVCDSSISTTLDPFAAYDGSVWNEASELNRGVLATGQPFVFFECVQARAGQTRCAIAVADCGDYRLVYQQ